MDRNFLAHHQRDAANAALTAVGYDFARLLAWLRRLLRAWISILLALHTAEPTRAEPPTTAT